MEGGHGQPPHVPGQVLQGWVLLCVCLCASGALLICNVNVCYLYLGLYLHVLFDQWIFVDICECGL